MVLSAPLRHERGGPGGHLPGADPRSPPAGDADAARFLAWPGDFDLDRGDHGEDVHLASGAALVAISLPELLRLLLVAPWWRDCRAFTAEESGELAAEYVEEMPDPVVRRDRAATALGLDLPAEADVLARLREVATEAGKDFVLILTPEDEPYDPLIKG
ncbi:hypothetical protein B046DRAFT_00717 [Streptomyces sp. LamerLS-316]|uniref:hypothetical protein n=1 Tax=unclassified Streptomyces TaxID=2593676 RepID=UPI000823F31C|nr:MULTISPECIES: hypothetical protein [unclassified Streptomyces]SCK09814.1 hypothetical protein B046DRAFT_00717 [Streptomyces sp. LamerLS-316]